MSWLIAIMSGPWAHGRAVCRQAQMVRVWFRVSTVLKKVTLDALQTPWTTLYDPTHILRYVKAF